MARQASANIAESWRDSEHQMQGSSFEELPDGVIEVLSMTGGMETSLPRDEVQKSAAEKIKNARIRDGKVLWRGGTVEVGTKPNSNEVVGLLLFLSELGEPWVVRVTPQGIYATNTDSNWFQVTGGTKAGTSSKIDATQLLNKLYMADGVGKVYEVEPPNLTFRQLPDAPHAQFVSSFGDRIIAAGMGAEPATIRWSGRLEPGNWDPSEDETAGFLELSATPAHRGDPITGLLSLSDRLIVLRERSIWEAARRAVPTAPFKFREVASDIGCDLPYTATVTQNNVIFASQEYNGVFVLVPGRRPQRISKRVSNQILNDLQALQSAEGAYDPFNQEYHLGIEETGDPAGQMGKVWVWSQQNDSWSFDDSPTITSIARVVDLAAITTIDDLGTTVIDNLTGTIDSLSESALGVPDIMKGTATGEVITHSLTQSGDYDGTLFQFEFISPNVGSISRRRTMMDHLVHYESSLAGDIILENSKDKENWRNTKQITLASTADPEKHKDGIRRGQVTGDDLYWRIRTQEVDVRLLNYWIRIMEKGIQHSP